MLEEEIISYTFLKFGVWAISILCECASVLPVYVGVIKISKQAREDMNVYSALPH